MNKKALIVIAVLFGAMLLFSVGFNVLVDRVADRVIHKIYKDYSPSPYGPGVDPDKLDINVFNRPKNQSPKIR